MSEQEKGPGGMSRRDFLKLLGAAGTSVAFAPFVPWGKFMPNPSSANYLQRYLLYYLMAHKQILTLFRQIMLRLLHIQKLPMKFSMRKRLGNGSLSDFLKKWVEEERMCLHLGHIAWSVFICGVCGSTGQMKEE